MEQADLSKPETIPATLVGTHTVIDCATGRPEEPIKTVRFGISLSSMLIFTVGQSKNQPPHHLGYEFQIEKVN